MVYGSAAVMPSGGEITEAGNNNSSDMVLRTAPGLISVQSDPSVLSKPKSHKHRRHNSLFSIFPSDAPQSKSISRETKEGSRASSRLKWEWKLADLWHSRSNKYPKNDDDLIPVSIESASSVDSIAENSAAGSPSPPLNDEINGSRGGSQASLHYTSLGIFASSKYSSSDLEVSASSTQSGDLDVGLKRVPLAKRWREIQGAHDWENLLDPLDSDLRAEILRYGDFAQMAYDNFQDESWSKYAGSARFSKKNVFEKLHKAEIGYQARFHHNHVLFFTSKTDSFYEFSLEKLI